MVLEKDKSNYRVLSKSKEPFVIRIFFNQTKLKRESQVVHLGLSITENLTWSKKILEMCKNKNLSMSQNANKIKICRGENRRPN